MMRTSEDRRLLPNAVTYNAMIRGEFVHGSGSQAKALLTEMRGQGLEPDVVTMNVLLRGIILAGDLPRAERLVARMKSRGPFPDQVTYSTLIEGYIRSENMTAAREVFREATAVTLRGDLPPDSVTFNSFVKACVRFGQVTEALQLVDAVTAKLQAERQGTDASLETASGWDGEQEFDGPSPAAGFAVKEQVLHAGRPDVVTFTTLIGAIATSENMHSGRKAMDLYRDMRDVHALEPDKHLVEAVVSAICNSRVRKTMASAGIEAARELVGDLQWMGWSDEEVDRVKHTVRGSFAAISEAWKDMEFPENPREGRGTGASDRIFRRHGWNQVESGFPFFKN